MYSTRNRHHGIQISHVNMGQRQILLSTSSYTDNPNKFGGRSCIGCVANCIFQFTVSSFCCQNTSIARMKCESESRCTGFLQQQGDAMRCRSHAANRCLFNPGTPSTSWVCYQSSAGAARGHSNVSLFTDQELCLLEGWLSDRPISQITEAMFTQLPPWISPSLNRKESRISDHFFET